MDVIQVREIRNANRIFIGKLGKLLFWKTDKDVGGFN
jgi:hypothetical protein